MKLRISNVSKTYANGVQALKDVTLTIPAGMYGLLLKGIGGRRARTAVVEALLKRVNLWDVRRQKLGGYSGGMRQRFGVAVALLGNPKLLIVDEPTAGLDPAERVRFLNLLSELGENSVVLLSTHIVEDVSELCTRMAIINEGRILLEAEPLRAIEDLRRSVCTCGLSSDFSSRITSFSRCWPSACTRS